MNNQDSTADDFLSPKKVLKPEEYERFLEVCSEQGVKPEDAVRAAIEGMMESLQAEDFFTP